MGERRDDDHRSGDRARVELSEFVSISLTCIRRLLCFDKRLEEIQQQAQ